MLRLEHEHTDTDPVSLHLTMECVKLVEVWIGWYGRSSAKADAVGDAAPVVRQVRELFATCHAKQRHILTSSLQKPA